MLNQENRNSIHPQTADFVYYQVPLASLLSVPLDLPFVAVLQILVCIEVVAAEQLLYIIYIVKNILEI